MCCPGFHKRMSEWAKLNEENKMQFDYISYPKELLEKIQSVKIPIKKGSLIIFSGNMLHCNFPNNSKNFRFVQYVKMIPSKIKRAPSEYINHRRESILKMLPEELKLSTFEMNLLGLKD
jgi:ectoine hydroxylase-related dioxygenase (phytanoyl-CoA dioxygenase family)